MSDVLNFALSLFLSITLVPVCIRYADILGLVDRPDGVRKIHTQIIPKSGGLAMALAVAISVLYSSGRLRELAPLLTGSAVIVIFGYLDDRFDINYKWKFVGQIIAITIFLTGSPQLAEKSLLGGLDMPGWLNLLVIFFFLLGVSNAINLSDGLDGLAAGLTLVSLGIVMYIAIESGIHSVYIASLALMGALMGFLRYNTHPAQVFMGDTGSQFIGYTCAALMVYLAQNEQSAISPVLPLMVLGLPIMDTMMVMVVRLYNGMSPFYPDKNHIHHQLMRFGFHHYEAVAILYIVQILLILTAFFIRYESELVIFIIYMSVVACCLGTLYILNRLNWTCRSTSHSAERNERRNLLLRKFNWVYLFSGEVIVTCIFLAWVLLVYTTRDIFQVVHPLSLLALLLTFVVGIALPKFYSIGTRIAAYSATVLGLYLFGVSEATPHQVTALNAVLTFMGLFLFLAIRMARREDFQLNNQDIIILFVLLVGPLLPFKDNEGISIGLMLFRISIMIYAIEYVINKSRLKCMWLRLFSVATLVVITFI